MARVWIDKQMLVQAISEKTDANKQEAKAIVNSVLEKQPEEHDKICTDDGDSLGLCQRRYGAVYRDNLELALALRSVYALIGEDNEVRKIIDAALEDYQW